MSMSGSVHSCIACAVVGRKRPGRHTLRRHTAPDDLWTRISMPQRTYFVPIGGRAHLLRSPASRAHNSQLRRWTVARQCSRHIKFAPFAMGIRDECLGVGFSILFNCETLRISTPARVVPRASCLSFRLEPFIHKGKLKRDLRAGGPLHMAKVSPSRSTTPGNQSKCICLAVSGSPQACKASRSASQGNAVGFGPGEQDRDASTYAPEVPAAYSKH